MKMIFNIMKDRMRKIFPLIALAASLAVLFPVSPARAGETPSYIEKEIHTNLEVSYRRYLAGDKDKALAAAQQAYFINFEGEGLESAIEARSPAKMAEIENLFVKITDEIGAGVPSRTLRADMDNLYGKLGFQVATLEQEKGQGGFALLVNALVVILREGFEAILILSALSAYLVKVGRKDRVKTIYAGGGVALAASLVMAVVFNLFFSTSGASKSTLEGVTLVFATAVLFYVSYWLIGKVQVVKWQKFIKSKVDGALDSGRGWTLAFAAFLAVFREGAETVLFYQALYSSAGGGASYILGGLGIGIVLLVVLFLVFRYGAVKIPLAPFFAVTSTLLYYLAFTFAGRGILELQEAGWISTTPLRSVPIIGFLGIYPSVQGISVQLFLVLAMFVAIVYSFLLKPYLEREKRLKEIVHIASDITGLHDSLEHITQHAMLCHELSSGAEGQELYEIRGHLREIDSKAHEVMDHLQKLESALSDIFEDMGRSFRKGA